MKDAVFISLSDPPCFSHDVHWRVFVFLSLPSCRESLSVRILRPSLSPKRALLCFSVTPSHSTSSVPFSHHMSKVICHVANFVFHPLPKQFWHRLSLYCTEAVPTQQFYMQQSNATPRPSTPSSGCLPQFPFGGRSNSIIHPVVFFFRMITLT